MWKQVVYNNNVTNYFVNEDGNIKSGYNGKILKPLLKKDGYYECCLYTSEAAKQTGINRKGINDCCNKKIKSSGGYIWKFLQEEIVQ